MAFNKTRIPTANGSRGTFDLGCYHHTTTDFGRLDVVNVMDVVPGDDIELSCNSTFRAAPMPTPTFTSVRMDVRHFFVPFRILCADNNLATYFDWKMYIDGLSDSTHPYITEGQLFQGKAPETMDENAQDIKRLYTMFGLPPRLWASTQIADTDRDRQYSPFRLAAYQRIWWDYYRDSNLIPDNLVHQYIKPLQIGEQDNWRWLLKCRYCCFDKDYFNTARPYPSGSYGETSTVGLSDTPFLDERYLQPHNVIDDASGEIVDQSPDVGRVAYPWIKAAEQLQKYLERNNLVGGRFIERMLARFGVAPDAKELNLSEYLGGSSFNLFVGDITTNNSNGQSSTNNAFGFTPAAIPSMVGRQSGKAALSGSSGSIKFHAKEYGVIMTISTLVPETGYFQGIDKAWTRGLTDRFEYFTPEMQSIGYQPVYKRELIASKGGARDNDVFGFQPRYSDYTYQKNNVSGDLLLVPTGMESLHTFRVFGNSQVPDVDVALNQDFSVITPAVRLSLDRIFSIPGSIGQFDHFQGFHKINCRCTRNMDACALPHLKEDGNNKISVEVGGMRF